MGAFQGNGDGARVILPCAGRSRVGKHRVILGVETVLILFMNVGGDGFAIDHDERGQPSDQILI